MEIQLKKKDSSTNSSILQTKATFLYASTFLLLKESLTLKSKLQQFLWFLESSFWKVSIFEFLRITKCNTQAHDHAATNVQIRFEARPNSRKIQKVSANGWKNKDTSSKVIVFQRKHYRWHERKIRRRWIATKPLRFTDSTTTSIFIENFTGSLK